MEEKKHTNRPEFREEARPRRVDPELLALDSDREVLLHWLPGRKAGCATGPASQLVAQVQEQIARQATGFFTLAEAAHILANANAGCDVRDLIQRMAAAKVKGRRLPKHPGSKLPVLEGEDSCNLLWVASPEDIDAWLEEQGAPYRFPAGAEKPKAPQLETQADPQRRLAALRALNGKATRMNGKWRFTKINELTASEKGRPRSDQKTIRRDLIEAAEAERKEGPKPALPSMFPT